MDETYIFGETCAKSENILKRGGKSETEGNASLLLGDGRP